MSLSGLGILNYENKTVNGENYLLNSILPLIIPMENPIFFDIGANVGNFRKSLFSSFPKAVIYAFEPHPKNFSTLNASLKSTNLKSYNLALGDHRGELTLYDWADSDGSTHASLHEAIILEHYNQDTVKYAVSVETLDDFCNINEVMDIDFIKIDTEGHELSVLEGAKKLIEKRRINFIYFEFNQTNIISKVFYRDFRILLKDYEFYRLLPHGALRLGDSTALTEIFAYQNIIAIPKEMKKPFKKALRKNKSIASIR